MRRLGNTARDRVVGVGRQVHPGSTNVGSRGPRAPRFTADREGGVHPVAVRVDLPIVWVPAPSLVDDDVAMSKVAAVQGP